MSNFRYINGDELGAIIKSDRKPLKDYVVIDVRDEDWSGGHIKGSFNHPSERFLEEVDDLVAETKHIPVVIIHCALSQARGPKAASIYAETRDRLCKDGKGTPNEVLVLRGGFTDFQARYRHDPELVENWDRNVWGY